MSDTQFENRMAALPNRIKHLQELVDRLEPELDELIKKEEDQVITIEEHTRLMDVIDIYGKAKGRLDRFKYQLRLVFGLDED